MVSRPGFVFRDSSAVRDETQSFRDGIRRCSRPRARRKKRGNEKQKEKEGQTGQEKKNRRRLTAPLLQLKPLGTVHLTGCKVEKDQAKHKQRSENVFVIIPPKSDNARVFFLSAESDKDMLDWMTVLRNSAALAEPVPFPNPTELLSDSFGNRFYQPLKNGFLEIQGRGFQVRTQILHQHVICNCLIFGCSLFFFERDGSNAGLFAGRM